eukprot:9094779-Prorocentrum_lima.AAC.1
MILERVITKDTKMPMKTMGITKNGTMMGDGMARIKKAKQKKSHLHPKKTVSYTHLRAHETRRHL